MWYPQVAHMYDMTGPAKLHCHSGQCALCNQYQWGYIDNPLCICGDTQSNSTHYKRTSLKVVSQLYTPFLILPESGCAEFTAYAKQRTRTRYQPTNYIQLTNRCDCRCSNQTMNEHEDTRRCQRWTYLRYLTDSTQTTDNSRFIQHRICNTHKLPNNYMV